MEKICIYYCFKFKINQFEISIFNDDNLRLYKDFLKEGNTLLFYVDISRDNENIKNNCNS